jgi:hypothetical protein
LFDPVADRLLRKAKLGRKIVGAAAGPGKFYDLLPEVGRVRPGMFSGHWGTLLR